MDPMIGHRLRAFLTVPAGSPTMAVLGYGLEERMPPQVIDRPRGTDDWLLMGFDSPARIWIDGMDARRRGGADSEAEPEPEPEDQATSGMQTGAGREIAAGTLMLWRPHAPHRYGHPSRAWRHSWIHIDGDRVRTRAATLGLPLESPIADVPTAWLDACIRGIHDEITGNGTADGEILAAHLDILLRRAARVARSAGGGTGGRRVPAGLLAARTHIEARFAEPLRLAALAGIAGHSVPHFCAGFRQHFALSPIDLVIRLRLAQARRLMTERHMTVAEAARQVGYADYRHFTRLFRKRYGMAPREMRRE